MDGDLVGEGHGIAAPGGQQQRAALRRGGLLGGIPRLGEAGQRVPLLRCVRATAQAPRNSFWATKEQFPSRVFTDNAFDSSVNPPARKGFLRARIARRAPLPRQVVAQGRRLRQQRVRQHPDAHDEAAGLHKPARGRCYHSGMSATVGRTRTLLMPIIRDDLYRAERGQGVYI